MHGQAVVVGVGESKYYKHGQSPDSEFQLACTAIRNAADDAGLELKRLDGLISYMDHRNSPLRIAAALGFEELRWSATPWAGGGNNSTASIQFADAAGSGGYANYVVAFRALAQGQFYRLGSGSNLVAGGAPEGLAWGLPYGLMTPAQECALQTRRWMHDHGVSQEALASISLACYANAQRNPRAVQHGKPLSREAYHASRWIVEPFHLVDCCMENDGAAALIVTTSERARDLPGKAVPILATAQGLGPDIGIHAFQPRWFPSMYYENVGRTLWERAGVKPGDVDVIQLYENFTGPVLMALCEMGYCKPEEVEDFVADGALEGPDARLPFNTSGGNLAEAYIHGLEMVVEAVRQSRGESTCQAPKVELSLAVGGPGYAPGSAVLFGAAG
ncbi:MAG: thiolase C-terminal domain-containing protein [Myxococcota bacterium]